MRTPQALEREAQADSETALAFVRRVVRRYGLSLADEQDITQDVAIKEWTSRRTFRAGLGNQEQWLSKILRNTVIDHYNERQRDPVDSMAAEMEPTLDEALEERVHAREMLACLSDNHRRVVVRASEGYTHREIAAELGISAATVQARLTEARAALEDGDE